LCRFFAESHSGPVVEGGKGHGLAAKQGLDDVVFGEGGEGVGPNRRRVKIHRGNLQLLEKSEGRIEISPPAPALETESRGI
jgi:hypothetical protein